MTSGQPFGIGNARSWALCSLLLLFLLSCLGPSASPSQPGPIPAAGPESPVFFLVRHTERTDDAPGASREPDPHLSEAGHRRAALLADMLKDAGLTHIHASDRIRTRETAAPTAAATSLEVSLYDPDDISGLADRLRPMTGRHLVVGHSNTTWDLVEALGGEPGPPIETREYDRMYMLIMGSEGIRTIVIRFGGPFVG